MQDQKIKKSNYIFGTDGKEERDAEHQYNCTDRTGLILPCKLLYLQNRDAKKIIMKHNPDVTFIMLPSITYCGPSLLQMTLDMVVYIYMEMTMI
jgi:hypothetical protein